MDLRNVHGSLEFPGARQLYGVTAVPNAPEEENGVQLDRAAEEKPLSPLWSLSALMGAQLPPVLLHEAWQAAGQSQSSQPAQQGNEYG